jgi:hypothetical protein
MQLTALTAFLVGNIYELDYLNIKAWFNCLPIWLMGQTSVRFDSQELS